MHFVGKDVHVHFLTGPRRGQQSGHHGKRALMMADHQLEKPFVEGRSLDPGQLAELPGGEHPRHGDRAVRGGIRHHLIAVGEPSLHQPDLGGLRLVDFLGEADQARVGTATLGQAGHLNCLAMVGDHPLHELHIGSGVHRAGSNRPERRQPVVTGGVVGVILRADGAEWCQHEQGDKCP